MIQTTREQRRQLERDNAKLPNVLQLMDTPEHLRVPGAPQRVFRSRKFLVQEYAEASPFVVVRLSVCRTSVDVVTGRWRDGIAWEDLQRIKGEVGYGSLDAVEIYPTDTDVVNVGNLRHLWILTEPVPFAWRK